MDARAYYHRFVSSALMSSTHSSDDIIIEKRFTTGSTFARSLPRSLPPSLTRPARFSRINVTYGSYATTCETEGESAPRELSTSPLSANNRRCTCTRRRRERAKRGMRGRDTTLEKYTRQREMPKRKQYVSL